MNLNFASPRPGRNTLPAATESLSSVHLTVKGLWDFYI